MGDSLVAIDFGLRHKGLVIVLVVGTALSCWRAGLQQQVAPTRTAVVVATPAPTPTPAPHIPSEVIP
jgi:hypothetical protein